MVSTANTAAWFGGDLAAGSDAGDARGCGRRADLARIEYALRLLVGIGQQRIGRAEPLRVDVEVNEPLGAELLDQVDGASKSPVPALCPLECRVAEVFGADPDDDRVARGSGR